MSAGLIHLALVLVTFTVRGGYSTPRYLVVPDEITVQMYSSQLITVRPSSALEHNVTLSFNCTKPFVACFNNSEIVLPSNTTAGRHVTIVGYRPGKASVDVRSSSSELIVRKAVLLVSVARSLQLDIFITIIGWCMFVCWTTSCYPQIITNFRRKSVVGLSFDLIALNILGFAAYSVYNVGMNWVPAVENEYSLKHPNSANPVALSDTIFGIHDLLTCFIVVFQIAIYERGDQTVSKLVFAMIAAALVYAVVTVVLVYVHVFSLLACLTFISYIKLAVQLTKYIPQIYLNFSRKSTEGYNIHQVLIDMAGGVFALVQMFLLAYNYEDYESITGDVAKLGLAILAIFFDAIFTVQHYCLYPATDINTETQPLLPDRKTRDPKMKPLIDWH